MRTFMARGIGRIGAHGSQGVTWVCHTVSSLATLSFDAPNRLRCFNKVGPHLRHRNPQCLHLLVSSSVRALAAARSLLPTSGKSGKTILDSPDAPGSPRACGEGRGRRQGTLGLLNPSRRGAVALEPSFGISFSTSGARDGRCDPRGHQKRRGASRALKPRKPWSAHERRSTAG
jgi:hypothetical protein